MQESSKNFKNKAGLRFDGGNRLAFLFKADILSANLSHCKQSIKGCAIISEFREKSRIVFGNLK